MEFFHLSFFWIIINLWFLGYITLDEFTSMANILNLDEIDEAKWLEILNSKPDKRISLDGKFYLKLKI